jgi:hypothetical protein
LQTTGRSDQEEPREKLAAFRQFCKALTITPTSAAGSALQS